MPQPFHWCLEMSASEKQKGRNLKQQKILDRLTYNPKKHKQKFIRSQRKLLQEKVTPKAQSPNIQSSSIKFSSFNVNGLDLETNWAVNELLEKR